VLPPEVYHRYEADQEQPWTIFWVHFIGSAAPAFQSALGVSISELRFWIGDLAIVTDAFEETYRYVLSGYTDRDLLGLALFGPFARTMSDSPKVTRSSKAYR
jgi:AraC family transcriptional regulator of arabinose operon